MSTAVEMEQLTSGASNRIIPVLKTLRIPLIFIRSMILCLLVTLFPRRRHSQRVVAAVENSFAASPSAAKTARRRSVWRSEEEDTLRRRALAETLDMGFETGDGEIQCRWSASLFFGVRRNALFCRSWFPATDELNGRYVQFAKQLTSCNFGVYAMDWTGHGGSDGLHGYVPSLDDVVADTEAFLEKIKSENPGVPLFLFGHSTGGAVVLKVLAPLFSLVVPKFQFKGANKRGIPVSRDPAAMLAKYSDPIRVRTGHEILCISSYLMRNFKFVTVPFFVLHGTADKVTDPLASQDLYNEAASKVKDIKLYEGLLHDLLFEPEREEIGQDIINWMETRLDSIAERTLVRKQ
ncbi:Monoglyceride lipase [Gossypium arboreum]|uniref:Monoglyceride lipase n=2 Tax=Gossypium arboreum TaxID=29729 RepID=A0A0B0NWB6_GOSAR|nr:Monoglyceride lipase [Gossypium arboreum]